MRNAAEIVSAFGRYGADLNISGLAAEIGCSREHVYRVLRSTIPYWDALRTRGRKKIRGHKRLRICRLCGKSIEKARTNQQFHRPVCIRRWRLARQALWHRNKYHERKGER